MNVDRFSLRPIRDEECHAFWLHEVPPVTACDPGHTWCTCGARARSRRAAGSQASAARVTNQARQFKSVISLGSPSRSRSTERISRPGGEHVLGRDPHPASPRARCGAIGLPRGVARFSKVAAQPVWDRLQRSQRAPRAHSQVLERGYDANGRLASGRLLGLDVDDLVVSIVGDRGLVAFALNAFDRGADHLPQA
jgi:hypothetical protein